MHLLTILGILLLLIIAGIAFIIYNNLIRLRNNVTRAWSNINALLEKRYDLLLGLINTVSGYKQYEKNVLSRLVEIRSSWEMVKDTNGTEDKMKASNAITTALRTIFADLENYPKLNADSTFIELQKNLAELEDEIANSREFYNDSVKVYNTNITVMPYNAVASILHYRVMSYFPDSQGVGQERQAVR